MKLIRENSNSSHINANGVHSDAAGTIGLLDTLLSLSTLGHMQRAAVAHANDAISMPTHSRTRSHTQSAVDTPKFGKK